MKMTGAKRIIEILITAGIISCQLIGCSSNKELSNYEQGVAALEEQNYSEALSCFKAAEMSHDDMQLVYRGEGMSYLGLSQYDEALAVFELALSESNGLVRKVDYDINYYMAVAEYKAGKLDDAIKTYTSIIAMDGSSSDAYYLRGKAYLEQGNVDLAKADFDEAVLLDKNNSKLYINIYEDLSGHGLDNDAKAYINTGVASVAKPTAYELGVFNYYLGDYTQARNYFEEASETKSSDSGIIYLGRTYVALDDRSYAVALFEEYTANNKTADIVFNELGLLKAEAKDYEGALAAFEAGLQNEAPVYKQTLMYNRIVANEFLGNFDAAKKQMEEYLKLYPGDEAAIREGIFLKSR